MLNTACRSKNAFDAKLVPRKAHKVRDGIPNSCFWGPTYSWRYWPEEWQATEFVDTSVYQTPAKYCIESPACSNGLVQTSYSAGSQRGTEACRSRSEHAGAVFTPVLVTSF